MAQPQVVLNDRRDGPFVATAGQDVFTYTFPIEVATEITVTQVAKIGGAITTPTFATIIGTEGGTITLDTPAALDDKIIIEGDRSLVRTSNYVTGGNYRGVDINFDLNRITKSLQELRRDADRSAILRPETANNVSAILPEPLGNTAIGWNAAGTALKNFATNLVAGPVPIDALDPTGATQFDHIEFDGADWVKVTNTTFAGILTVVGVGPTLKLSDSGGTSGFLTYSNANAKLAMFTNFTGDTLTFSPGQQTLNLTLSGALGSELAAFTGNVELASGGSMGVGIAPQTDIAFSVLNLSTGVAGIPMALLQSSIAADDVALRFRQNSAGIDWTIGYDDADNAFEIANAATLTGAALKLADSTGDATFVGNVGVDGDLTAGDGVGAQSIFLDGGAGVNKAFDFLDAGVLRYRVFQHGSTEDFRINRHDNVGALEEVSFKIDGTTGYITVANGLQVNGDSSDTLQLGTASSLSAFNAFRDVGQTMKMLSARPRMWIEGTDANGQAIIFADAHAGSTADKRTFVIFNGGGVDQAKFETYTDAGVLVKTYMVFDHDTLQIQAVADFIFTSNAPSSKTDTGAVGTFTWDRVDVDNGFLYIATGTDEWQRVATVSWV